MSRYFLIQIRDISDGEKRADAVEVAYQSVLKMPEHASSSTWHDGYAGLAPLAAAVAIHKAMEA